MFGRRTIFGSICAIAGLGAGAVAGLDAGGHVDAFYTAPRLPVERAIPISTQPPSAWDQGRTFAAAPLPGVVWGQEVGRAERAFFAENPAEEVWREEPVRVHRASVTRVEVAEPAPVETADDPVDGWVEPPAPAAEDVLPQPVLG